MVDHMADRAHPAVPKIAPPNELDYYNALIAGLARVAAQIGRGTLADKAKRTTRAMDKLFAGDSMDTSGKGLLDFLAADASILDEVVALYGFRLVPTGSVESDDMSVIADLMALAAKHTAAIRDGRRDHKETIEIANMARMVVATYSAIIEQADDLRLGR